MLTHIDENNMPRMVDVGAKDDSELASECAFKLFVTVKITGKTGVEMEALTGVSVGLLTIYDMLKAIDKSMQITGIVLQRKEGGKSGVYIRG